MNQVKSRLRAVLHWLRPGLHGSQAQRVNLALQGGGAHGAFTWGVLDALLEDGRVSFEGLSGSSAGAMNAVLMAQGWMAGAGGQERQSARQALTDFWSNIGQQMPPGVVSAGLGDTFNLMPIGKWMAQWAGNFTPGQLNPLALNPLRDLLAKQVDFERLRTQSPFKLFVGATQVNTGRLRVFRENEMSLDVLMASACLPKLYDPVEIEGQPYWDGGYCANPPVSPLLLECNSQEVLLVLLNLLQHENTPHTVEEIETRLEDLAFNASFLCEMQTIAQVTQYKRGRVWWGGKFAPNLHAAHFHMIDTSQLESLSRSETKQLAHAPFLQLLFRQGRERAAQWLAAHHADIGRCSTIDLKAQFG